MSRSDLYANLSDIKKARDGASANTSKTAADISHDAVQAELKSLIRGRPTLHQVFPPAQIAGIEEPAPPPPPRTRSSKEHIPPRMTSMDDKHISNPGREAPKLPSRKDERSANQLLDLKSTKSTPYPSPSAPGQKSSAVVNRTASLPPEETALPSQPRTSSGKTHNTHNPVDDPVLQHPVVDLKTNRTVLKSPEKPVLRSTASEPPPPDTEHSTSTTSGATTAISAATKPVPGIKPPPPFKPFNDKILNNTNAPRSTNETLPTAPIKQVRQGFNKSHSCKQIYKIGLLQQ